VDSDVKRPPTAFGGVAFVSLRSGAAEITHNRLPNSVSSFGVLGKGVYRPPTTWGIMYVRLPTAPQPTLLSSHAEYTAP